MNINSNEILLLNKKMMKLRDSEPQASQETKLSNSVVTNPESIIEGLETQGQNNLAFQGVAQTIKNGALKAVKPALAALVLMAVSCTEDKVEFPKPGDIYIENEVTVTVDMSAWANFFQQMLENDKINQEQMNTLISLMTKFASDNAAFKEAMLNYIMNDSKMQEAIYNQLVENGKTEKEALAVLDQIFELMEAGKFEEAFALLEEILSVVKDIRDIVKTISEQMANNHKELMAAKKEEIDMLGKLYEQGKIDQSYLEDLFQNTKVMNESLEDIKASNNELKAIFTDEEKYNKFLTDIGNLMPSDTDYGKLEELFKMYGFASLQEVIDTARKDIIGAINNFENTYIKTEEGQTALLKEAINKLDFISTYLPEMDQSAIEAAIKELTDAVNNNTEAVDKNTEVVDKGLNDINNKLDVIIEKFDKVIDNTTTMVNNYAKQKDAWNSVLKELNKSNEVLEEIRKEQKLTNGKLDAFKDEFAKLKEEQILSNSYLNILVRKADDLQDAIKEIAAANGNVAGMTVEEFIEAMKDRDEARDTKLAEGLEDFIKKYGFDKLSPSVQTIEELVASIDDKIANQKDYSAQLDGLIKLENQILAFLKQADFSNPDYTAKLDEIIERLENFKCDCECGTNSGNHEGILGDILG